VSLSPHEADCLRAMAELARRQHEIEPLIAATLGRSAFDYWIVGDGRDDPALARLDLTVTGEWRFRFHGLEVDAAHAVDGRSVRIDFGPGGVLALSPTGIGQFAMKAAPPWRVFPELKAHLHGTVDYDYWRCVALCDALRAQGLIAYARPDLVALLARHTRMVPGRGQVIDLPEEDPPRDENDVLLCDRLVLTADGEAWLAREGT